jgi:HSP20 family molecular chaperone IbpA
LSATSVEHFGSGEELSDRWWRRRKNRDEWFNDLLSESEKIEKDIDAIVHRAFMDSSSNEKSRKRSVFNLSDQTSSRASNPEAHETDDPLIDVFDYGAYVTVVAELCGVDRDSIEVHATEDKLTISVDSLEHKFCKEIRLPARVDTKSSVSTLKNGVLEIRLRKLGEKLLIG